MKQRLLLLSMLFVVMLVGCGQSTLQKAEDAAANGELETAVTEFTDALTESLTPEERFRALKGRATVYDEQENETAAVDDFEDAADQLETIIKDKPDEIFLLMELALVQTRLESWDKVVEATNTFLEIDETDGPVRVEALSLRGKAQLELRDFEAAIADLKASLQGEIDDASADVEGKRNLVDAYTRLADGLRGLGEYDESITHYSNALVYTDGTDEQAYVHAQRGFTYVEMGGETENAFADLDRAVSLDPTMAIAYAYRSYAYGDEGDYESSISDADQAVELGDDLDDSTRSALYHSRASSHEYLKNYEQAIEDATQSIELETEDEANTARTYSLRSRVHFALENYAEAFSDADYAIEIGANDIAALGGFYRNRSYANYALDNFEDALEDQQASMAVDEPTAGDYEYEGDLYSLIGEYDKTISSYQSAIQLEPDNAWLHNYLGDIYYEMDEFGEAETEYLAAIQLDDEIALFHENLGYTLRFNEKWEEAVTAYSDALALDPDSPYSYYGRGHAHYWLDNNDEAIRDLEKALSYDIEQDLVDFINELLDEMN